MLVKMANAWNMVKKNQLSSLLKKMKNKKQTKKKKNQQKTKTNKHKKNPSSKIDLVIKILYTKKCSVPDRLTGEICYT